MSIADAVAISPISAPAAKARSEPPRTMQRTSPSSSSERRTSASSPISSPFSAFSRSGRLSSAVAIRPAGSPSTTTSGAGSVIALLLDEAPHGALRLRSEHRQGEPVAGVIDGFVPGEVAPEVELLLGIPGRLRQRGGELLDQLVDGRGELGGGDDPVDEAPGGRLRGRDLLAEHHDLPGAALADHDREPLGRAAGRHRAVLEP